MTTAILTGSVAVPAVARDRPYNKLVNLWHGWSVTENWCTHYKREKERIFSSVSSDRGLWSVYTVTLLPYTGHLGTCSLLRRDGG